MKKGSEFLGFALGWFAIIGQFVLSIQNRTTDISETIIRFFSFFTILTNLLVALYFTAKIFRLRRGPFALYYKPGALTALTVFILLVGIVYQVILRVLWEPVGLQRVVDELLHTVIPLYVLGYWYRYALPTDMRFRAGLYGLAYPLLYFVWIMVRGHFSNFYPYPFVNVPEIGWGAVALNFICIFGLILLLLALLVYLGKKGINFNR